MPKERLNLAEMPQHEVDELFEAAARTPLERAADHLAFKHGRAFAIEHPEFNNTEYNRNLLTSYVAAMDWPEDRDSIEKAFAELTIEGSFE